jgi:hypothetical protein
MPGRVEIAQERLPRMNWRAPIRTDREALALAWKKRVLFTRQHLPNSGYNSRANYCLRFNGNEPFISFSGFKQVKKGDAGPTTVSVLLHRSTNTFTRPPRGTSGAPDRIDPTGYSGTFEASTLTSSAIETDGFASAVIKAATATGVTFAVK